MITRKGLPTQYDENYILTFQEQTVIIEISFIIGYLLEQIRMPMVTEVDGGDNLVMCFQRCAGACLHTLMREGVMLDEFYQKHKAILCEEFGIINGLNLNILEVSDLIFDTDRLLSRYMVILGHELEMPPESDFAYGSREFFSKRLGGQECQT